MSEFQGNTNSRPRQEAVADLLQEAHAKLQQAERLRQQGQYQQARAICESLLEQHPDYADVLHTFGLIFADQELHEDALDHLIRALMQNPRNWKTLTALGGVYLRLGAIELAAQTLEQAHSLQPQDASVMLMLGDSYREQREYENARDAYLQATKLQPSLVAAAIGLGWTYENLGNVQEAAAVFEGLIHRGMRLIEPLRALAALPPAAVGIDLLAQVDKAVKDPREDQRQFENSRSFVRAAALDRAGRHAEAWQELVRANRAVFAPVQGQVRRAAEWRLASLAALRMDPVGAPPASSANVPISLFILGPSRSGKTSMEALVATLPGVKRGYENPIVERALRRTFQTAGLPGGGSLATLPPALYHLCRDIYCEELAKRIGSATVFTNTLASRIADAAHLTRVIPNVRFIFLKRDLDDILLRLYMRQYTKGNAYAYDLKAARDYVLWYREMIDLMAKKLPETARIIDYEDMVRDPAAVRATAAALCGLPTTDKPPPKPAGDIGCAAPYRQLIAAALSARL